MGRPLKNYVVAADGDVTAGVVLQKIAFWCSLNAKRGQGAETALKITDLADQLGCTVPVARKATDRLLEAGLVTKTVKRFGRDLVGHWRLTSEARKAIDRCPTGQRTLSHRTTVDAPQDNGRCPTGQPYISTFGSEHVVDTNKAAVPDGTTGFGDQGAEEGSGEGSMTTMNEVAGGAFKKPSPRAVKITSTTVKTTWRDVWVKHHGSWFSTFTAKQAKLLVTVAEDCANAGFDFETALDRLFTDWDLATEKAKIDAGAFSIPALPTIEWLYQWRQPLVMYLAQQKAPKAPRPAITKGTPVQSIASPEPAVDDPPEDAIPTKEELAKLLAEDD